MNPQVSVIVPYYNEGELVRRAIESVRAQAYEGEIEIIVVDDLSSDPAENHLPAMRNLRLFRNKSSLHAAGSRNVGIEHAAGKYICFLDADDLYLEGRLEPHIRFLEENPDIGLVGSGHLASRHGRTWEYPLVAVQRACGGIPQEPTILPAAIADEVFLDYLFHTGAFTVRTEIIRAAGGFNATYTWGEDWDLFVRLAQTHKIGFVPGIVYHYIGREGSICSTNSGGKLERMARLYRDWLRLRPLPRRHRRIIRGLEHQSLLLAAQFYLEQEGCPASAWRCAARAALCGASIWGIRSFIRTSLHLPSVILK